MDISSIFGTSCKQLLELGRSFAKPARHHGCKEFLPKENPQTEEEHEYAAQFEKLVEIMREKRPNLAEEDIRYEAARLVKTKFEELRDLAESYRSLSARVVHTKPVEALYAVLTKLKPVNVDSTLNDDGAEPTANS